MLSSEWYGGGYASSTPEFLAVSLDNDSYDIGDTAQLRIVAPTDGVAMVSGLSNRVIDQRTLTVQEGENVIVLPVTAEWGEQGLCLGDCHSANRCGCWPEPRTRQFGQWTNI